MIQFTSIVPRWFGGTSLSLVVLKSYLLHQWPDMQISMDTFFSDEDAEVIAEKIVSKKHRIFGFSVYMWNLKTVLDICRLLKKKNPDCITLLGGPTASFDAENIINDHAAVDMIVRGEGEIPLYRVISELETPAPRFGAIPNLIYRKDGKVAETARVPSLLALEEQHYPLDIQSFEGIGTVYMETSRGCVFECAYCAWDVCRSGLKRIRRYPLEKILKEIRRLFNLRVLDMLLFTDSNLVLGGERTLKILKTLNRMNQERRKKGWPLVKVNFEFNPEHLIEKLLPEIKKLHVENYPIGLQSVNKGVLKASKRSFNRDRYLKNIDKLREKTGAAILVELIFGLPTDNYEGFRRTLEFTLSELRADLFVCYRYSVLPGSGFWDDREKYGLRYEQAAPYHIISSDTFSEEDLNRAETLVYYLQIIFRVFRSLKKYLDKHIQGEKLPVYEEIAAMFAREYEHFLRPKLIYHDGFLKDVAKLRAREHADIRRQMIAKARRIIKEKVAQSGGNVRSL
jgi:radical SAM superfamily enzyme YgiQ (UPF0313 family)